MGNTICIYYCVFVIPFLFSVFIMGAKARKYVIYLIIGITSCLIASVVNSLLQQNTQIGYLVLTTTYTPIVEEIFKALPVFYYGIIFSNEEDELTAIGFATGIGFAILENGVTLLLLGEDAGILWAFLRGFSTSLMHAMTTALVGLGIALIRKRKKLFVTGTFTFLTLAIVYHATFNELIQSDFKGIAIFFPFVTFLLLILVNSTRLKESIRARMKKTDA